MSKTTVPAHFHAGSNDPGYLHDSSPACFDSWDEAKAYVISELLMDADNVASWAEEHDCDDVPCPTYGDDCPESKASELTFAAEELNLESGNGWDAILAGRSYWITQADEECDEDEDDSLDHIGHGCPDDPTWDADNRRFIEA